MFDHNDEYRRLQDGERLEIRKHLNAKWWKLDLRYALAVVRKSGSSSEVRWAWTRWGINRARTKYVREVTSSDLYRVVE